MTAEGHLGLWDFRSGGTFGAAEQDKNTHSLEIKKREGGTSNTLLNSDTGQPGHTPIPAGSECGGEGNASSYETALALGTHKPLLVVFDADLTHNSTATCSRALLTSVAQE